MSAIAAIRCTQHPTTHRTARSPRHVVFRALIRIHAQHAAWRQPGTRAHEAERQLVGCRVGGRQQQHARRGVAAQHLHARLHVCVFEGVGLEIAIVFKGASSTGLLRSTCMCVFVEGVSSTTCIAQVRTQSTACLPAAEDGGSI